jgi:Superfamily II DNA/RNA helicases, SNF2 family
MTESVEHKNLVDDLVDYVSHIFPEIDSGYYLIDNGSMDSPPKIGDGHRPDFYCEGCGYLLIGEAKTKNDIINDHTELQFESYLERCYFAEKNEDITPVIIYNVPIEMVARTRNYLNALKNKSKYKDIEIRVRSPLQNYIENHTVEEKNQPKIIFKRDTPIETKIKAFDYQERAFNFVKDLDYSAIFHEQGLGKTKIAMDLLIYWLKESVVDTVIIVTKKSLIYNWLDEFKKHTTLVPRVIGTSRKYNYHVFNSPCRIIITNFEVFHAEEDRFELLLKVRNVGIIIDESAKMKNPNSKITKSLMNLSALFKKRVIMTGTPVANRPYDLWSQIYFLDHGESLGNDFSDFRAKYDIPKNISDDGRAQKDYTAALVNIFSKLNKFTVRETKNSGIIKLPPKEYHSIEVPFEYDQKLMYDEIRLATSIEVVKNGVKIEDDLSEIIKKLTRLIEITSNPLLVDESYSHTPPKITALTQLLKTINEKDEKVIIWTAYAKNIPIIKKYIQEYKPVIISGNMCIEDRNNSVNKFKNDSDVKVLIATNAAKEGLTLTVANNAIFFDRTLSLDDYLQAQDRIHRISQTETCNIYNIKVTNSIDEWIDVLVTSKHSAAKLVQGDITGEEYTEEMDYSFETLIRKIFGDE